MVAAIPKSGIPKLAIMATVGAALVGGVAAGFVMLQPRGPDAGTFHGTRLGMTANAVRQRFEPPAPGAWQSVASSGGDVVLAWRALGEKDGTSGPRPAWSALEQARFELHSGMLVAVRARVAPDDPEAKRPPLEVTGAVVRVREAGEGGLVNVTILARDCPTHAAEAARLAAGR